MQTLYILEAVNLICGDAGNEAQPGASTHLSLQELKLPGLEEAYVDHNAGGALVGIEVPMGMNRLEATFNLAGWKPEVMTMIGRSQRSMQRFTAYGVLRDRRTGVGVQARAFMEGRLGRVNPTAFRRGDMHAHEFSIRSLVHYELYQQSSQAGNAESEIFYWDFFESARRVGGVDLNREINNILNIPGGTISPAS